MQTPTLQTAPAGFELYVNESHRLGSLCLTSFTQHHVDEIHSQRCFSLGHSFLWLCGFIFWCF